jgi:hypothetical protein
MYGQVVGWPTSARDARVTTLPARCILISANGLSRATDLTSYRDELLRRAGIASSADLLHLLERRLGAWASRHWQYPSTWRFNCRSNGETAEGKDAQFEANLVKEDLASLGHAMSVLPSALPRAQSLDADRDRRSLLLYQLVSSGTVQQTPERELLPTIALAREAPLATVTLLLRTLLAWSSVDKRDVVADAAAIFSRRFVALAEPLMARPSLVTSDDCGWLLLGCALLASLRGDAGVAADEANARCAAMVPALLAHLCDLQVMSQISDFHYAGSYRHARGAIRMAIADDRIAVGSCLRILLGLRLLQHALKGQAR